MSSVIAISQHRGVALPENKQQNKKIPFSEQMVFNLLECSDPFPVDLDDAIAWWDCKTKKGKPVAKRELKEKLEANFDKDLDYQPFGENSPKGSGRPKGKIYLTVDCFKQFGMMVSGDRGKEIRRYFLNCEAELKRRNQAEQNKKEWRAIKACVLPEPRSWRMMFPKSSE